jgi:hypothetical protein
MGNRHADLIQLPPIHNRGISSGVIAPLDKLEGGNDAVRKWKGIASVSRPESAARGTMPNPTSFNGRENSFELRA